MDGPFRPAWKRYAVSVVVTGLAALVRAAYAHYAPDVPVPFAAFYPAIALAAIYGGFGPGLLSLVLSLGAGWFYVMPTGFVNAGHTRLTLTTFAITGSLLLALTYSLAHARRRTDRVLDEARAAREQFDNVLERVSDAFITLDRDFRITYVNHAASRLNRKPAADMIGRTHWEEWPRSVGSRVEQVYRQAMTDRAPAHFEHLYSDPPVHLWLEIEVYPARDGGLAIFYRDITSRKTAERQLDDAHRQIAEHAQELQTLLDVAPVGIALAHDPECRVITSSIGMARMLGTSPDVNISKSRPDPEALPFRVYSPDGHEITPDDLPMQLAARTGRIVSDYEYVIAFDDGRRRNWLVNAAPLVNDVGAVRGAVGVHIDITARKQAEEALRLAAGRLDAHFDNSPLGVVEWDADFHVTRWSHGAERILGWGADEIRGKRIDEFPMVFEDDWPSVSALMRDMIENVRPRNMNRNRNRRRDGSVVVCEWYNSAIFDTSGRLVSILSQVVDVTARESAERDRSHLLALAEAAREQAERANAAKDEFLAMLSHELRAPMQSVLGWVRVLERSALDPEMQARAVRTIERNIRQQSQLINDMLDVSRIVAGKLSIEPGETDLSALVEQTVEELAPEIHEKDLAVSTDIAPALRAVADHERIHQVLLNVVGNAVKFTPVGGRVAVACAAAGADVVITVRDNGVGIDPELLTEIFDRFRQGDASSTRRHEGLGLGLSIAKHIVEQHGGSITAESGGTGAGATFTIRLPLVQQPGRPAHEPASQADIDLAGIDVLLVDDHADTLELLQFVVTTSGASARCAASAKQALALFQARRPDIVITDVSMPAQDGFDLLASIRACGGTAVPAVALTGLADASSRARALASGFNAHLAKPVEPHVLVATIREVLRAAATRSSPPEHSAI